MYCKKSLRHPLCSLIRFTFPLHLGCILRGTRLVDKLADKFHHNKQLDSSEENSSDLGEEKPPNPLLGSTTFRAVICEHS